MPRYVAISFLDRFRDAMLNDVKDCTTRMRPMGQMGDRFIAFGAEFELLSIEHVHLGDVADILWKEEGASSRSEFIEIWKTIHPRKGFDPARRAWLHRFRRVTT